ncbi:NrsF family protein (plasmid) [Ensifer adhaerens]|uniref:NrsF family protein n=1 Tax=Ensifer adhaerens TaxID=106592 RepID=UPI0023AA114F|nr:NrsF family protein [Ensifer adhaerens]WDZ79582.1 NrsF family protein [Ensifer adhaerens]
MDTNELIKALAADARRPGLTMNATWRGAAAGALMLAGLVFFMMLGPRPDIATAVETVRFLFKFVVTIALAAAAFATMRVAAWPEAELRRMLPYLGVAPALVLAGVVLELIALPSDAWGTKLIGTNSMLCLTFIPLIGLAPLALFLLALRHGAPSRPSLSGALAGLAAGGIAATFYAAHCPDDSPLFVATWYTIAILGLTLLGAIAARWAIRW